MSEMKEEKKRNYVVYRIVLEDGSVYIGSTTNLGKRISYHINDCYNPNASVYNIPLYVHIRENKLKFNKSNFVVLEDPEKITKTQSRMIEEQYRKEAKLQGGKFLLNACRAYATEEELKEDHREKNREYRAKNRDEISKKNKEYSAKNRDKKERKNSQKYTCICGSILRIDSKNKHNKSQKHINYINNLL